MSKFKKEPAVIIGAAVGVVGSGLTLAASLGLAVTPDQTAGICAGLLTVAGVVQGLVTRQFVYSPASHELEVDLAEAHAADGHADIDADELATSEPEDASDEPVTEEDDGSASVVLTPAEFKALLERAGAFLPEPAPRRARPDSPAPVE